MAKRTKSKKKNFKCIVIGDSGVGKTSMIIKYSTDNFPFDYIPVVYDGAYSPTPHIVDGVTVNLSIWDTGGGEDYDRLRPLSYPMTDVFIACFSVAEPRSFQSVRTKYAPEVAYHNPDTPILLVGTKSDLRGPFSEFPAEMRTRPVYDYEGLSLSEHINAGSYMECSSLTGHGLREVFEKAMQLALNNYGREVEGNRSSGGKFRCVIT